MSYYSQYLFQSPLYEDTYYDYDVYDYLNENFYPAEINEIYKDFLIENFGIQIIDEDYYDYIVNRYGEENLLREMVYSLNEYLGLGHSNSSNNKRDLVTGSLMTRIGEKLGNKPPIKSVAAGGSGRFKQYDHPYPNDLTYSQKITQDKNNLPISRSGYNQPGAGSGFHSQI